MVNYKNSIIYKLCCKNPEITDIYIGSTTNFTRRKYEHKSKSNNINSKKYNLNVYKFIRENGCWDNWDMIIIEKFECNDKLELHKKERHILEQLGATLNSQIPNRSIKEWGDNNKEKLNEYNKEYQKKKVECKVCGKIMNKGSLTRHNKRFHYPAL